MIADLDRAIFPLIVKFPKAREKSFMTVHRLMEAMLTATPILRKPWFSIIVPIYGHADYLEGCIRSALNQTYENFEVILVDDCSPDPRVREILDKFADEPRIVFQRNSRNSGISITQNNAVKLANYKWIAFLDCDDQLEPDALFWMAKAINLHPRGHYFFSDRLKVDEIAKQNSIEYYGGAPHSFFRPIAFREKLLRNMVASHLKVIHRDAYWAVGGSDEAICGIQDWDTALKMAGKYHFVYVPKPIYRYRWHTDSNTLARQKKLYRPTNVTRRRALTSLYGERQPDTIHIVSIDQYATMHEEQLIYAWKSSRAMLELKINRSLSEDEVHKIGVFNSYFDRFLIPPIHPQFNLITEIVWDNHRVLPREA